MGPDLPATSQPRAARSSLSHSAEQSTFRDTAFTQKRAME